MKMKMKWLITLAFLVCATAEEQDSSRNVTEKPDKNDRCFKDLGCFPITSDFFHPIYRPVNLRVADRESINTQFYVFTRADPRQGSQIRAKDKTLLAASGFDAKKQTKLIVHGWVHKVFREWMLRLKDEYLLKGDYNIIVVDWSGGNQLPYTQATSNTRVVGAEIALLLQWLKDTEGLKLEDCHILGHSLGAHVAGYAGERLDTLGRITAMDAAAPYFQYMPPSVRIDPTDADFVDVIHSDSKSILPIGLGVSQLVGHVDFFPNGGFKQPGCDQSIITSITTEGLVDGMGNAVACNHLRSVDFALDSVNHHKCVYTGFACPDWETFQQGKCTSCGAKGDECAVMGDSAPGYFKNGTNQRAYYLKTAPKEPFCLYHYQVSLTLQDPKAKDQEGTLTLTLSGIKSEEKFHLQDGNKIKLFHGSSYTFLLSTEKELGSLTGVTFYWDAGFQILPWPKRVINVHKINVVPMNIIENSARKAETRSYCTSKRNMVESRISTTFTTADVCK